MLLAAAKRFGYVAPHAFDVLAPSLIVGALIPLLVGVVIRQRGELPVNPELSNGPSRLADSLLIVAYSLAVCLWVASPVFLGAILFIHVPRVSAEPVESIVSVITAAGISIVLMWGSGFVVRCARKEAQDIKRRPTPHSR